MKKVWWGLAAVVLLAIGALIYLSQHNNFYQTPTTPSTSKSQSKLPDFDHVVIIVFENKGYSTVMDGAQAPYFQKLARENSLASKYYANFHPSLPNYIAMTSGTNAGITNDCNPPGGSCVADVKNVADEIEASGRSWKTYQEGMPSNCTTQNIDRYATRHNPFIYYPDILNDKTRCQSHVVPYTQLAKDIERDQLPNYAFITPNLCHDMHDCSVKTGNDWLAEEAPKILNAPTFKNSDSLLVVTFDEAEGGDQVNRIPTILAGQSVKRGFVSDKTYNHYSLLHTIEAAWRLKPLTKNDANAPVMSEFFKG